MEEKKFDKNSIIGFALIFGIIMWMMYNSQKTAQEEQAQKIKQEKIDKAKKAKEVATKQVLQTVVDTTVSDTVKLQKLSSALGSFAYSATLPSAKESFTTIENELVTLKIANKGGYIAEAVLKNYKKFEKNSGQLVELIKNNNANFNLELQTKDNRVLNTKDLFFEPTLTKNGNDQILSMKLKSGANEFLEYKYVLKAKDYMLDFDVRTQGLSKVLNTAKAADLQWDLKTYRNEKSVSYENRYAEIYFENDGKVDYAGLGKQEDETLEKATFIAYKQHFFSSILLSQVPIANVKVSSTDLVNDAKNDTVFTKQFKTTLPLAFKNGELDYKMNW